MDCKTARPASRCGDGLASHDDDRQRSALHRKSSRSACFFQRGAETGADKGTAGGIRQAAGHPRDPVGGSVHRRDYSRYQVYPVIGERGAANLKTTNWIQSIRGYVLIEVRGGQLEKLLNRLTEKQIAVWDIRYLSEGQAEMMISLKDFFR